MRLRFDRGPVRLSLAVWLGCSAGSALVGCAWEPPRLPQSQDAAPPIGALEQARGNVASAHDVSVLTWNLNWFQDAAQGPKDDQAQYDAVRAILTSSHATLIALQEVASEAAFDRLLSDLPRYAGVLSGYAWTQKTALLWKRDAFELRQARAISGLDDAGRPPLQLDLERLAEASTWRVVVIHAKAQSDAASHARREQFASELKRYLDETCPDAACIVLGDFNDRLTGSITTGAASPYQDFLEDPHYFAVTRGLDEPAPRESSYLWGPTIDHILVSEPLEASVEVTTIEVLRDESLQAYPAYGSTVSDHFPVEVTLRR